MKKAMVFAAVFAAGSALAQVGSVNGGSISDIGAGGRYGAGPQIPGTDARANSQASVAAPPPRTSATVGAPAISGSTSGTASTAAGTGPAPITSGTSWGSPQTAAPIDAAQAPRAPLIDKADRPAEKP